MNEQAAALTERTVHGRYLELDALRGIAAFTVVWHHFSLAYSYIPSWLLAPFFAGHEAVLLFFVLSGFVLSLPFWNKGGNGLYAPYLLRRFFRIYVPFAAAVVVAATCAHFFLFSRLPLGPWFKITWQTSLTPPFLLSQFLVAADPRLNTAFWSLRYEVQLSIVFPLLLLLLRRLGTWPSLLFAVLVHYVGLRLGVRLPDFHWYQDTLRYSTMFMFGAIMASERERLRLLWARSPIFLRSAFAAGGCYLYFYGDWLMHRIQKPYFGDLVVSVGACCMVVLALYARPLRSVLLLRVPEYLGRVSYSLYLMHGTVLFVLLNLLYGKVPMLLIATIFLLTSLVLSHVFCALIEEPSLREGKRLAIRKPARMSVRSVAA